ncbi:MAG TPA: LuxR C-terminal-related transcriptional regulator [Jiangellaceae bacterium]|nr:LuxR C-terminal-related transcriptional regulator [Jiangellaceae bacterium]
MPLHAIRRVRLEQLLDEHPDRQVILVRGPVGAGKTVLVAQWVRALTHPWAWFAIDATHDNATVLLRQLVELVEQYCPDAHVVGQSTVGDGIGYTVLRDVLNVATDRLGSSITLVLDDVHRVHDRTARLVLELLIEQPPDRVRVVLVSRSKPRLGLERARLRGDLVEITPAALRFERAEIDALASTWPGAPPDAADLERTTLGWAAGLRLAQLETSTPDVGSPTMSEPDGIVSAYIREELIDASSPDACSFLEASCWLPSLSDEVCTTLTSLGSGRRRPARPDIEALPILPIASRPGAFRYPPILTRVLQQECRRRDPEAAMSARRRAAEACRVTGELVTSVELFLQAGCTDEAADVCTDLAAGGELSLRHVDELHRRVPEITPASPRWLPWQIRAALAAGRVDEARRLLAQAGRAAASSATAGQADSPDLVMARALMAEHAGDVATLLACADRLLESAEQTGAGPCSVARIRGWRIRALLWSGDTGRAREALGALVEAAAGAAVEAPVDVALARAWTAWFEGDISDTTERVATARREVGDDGAGAGELALLTGSASRERNQLAKAVPILQEAGALAAASSHAVVAALAASELARCHRAAGASMEALELVVSTRAAHPDLPPAVDLHLRSTEVRVRLDQGDLVGARDVVRGAPQGVDTQLLAARVALHQAPAQARELMDDIDARTPRQAVDKLLLCAQLPDAEPGDESAALAEAISAGGPLGLMRTFLDEGPTLSRRLSDLALEHIDRSTGRLGALACHELALAPTRQPTGPIEQLTARELAVLRMLPLRMSNREMAAQLYISVNTLKTHVRAIYRKLDAPHRSAAVRRATVLQLV